MDLSVSAVVQQIWMIQFTIEKFKSIIVQHNSHLPIGPIMGWLYSKTWVEKTQRQYIN